MAVAACIDIRMAWFKRKIDAGNTSMGAWHADRVQVGRYESDGWWVVLVLAVVVCAVLLVWYAHILRTHTHPRSTSSSLPPIRDMRMPQAG